MDTVFEVNLDADIIADCNWADEQRRSGAFDCFDGDFIAILYLRIVGSGNDETALREKCAALCNVSPDRILTVYNGDYWGRIDVSFITEGGDSIDLARNESDPSVSGQGA